MRPLLPALLLALATLPASAAEPAFGGLAEAHARGLSSHGEPVLLERPLAEAAVVGTQRFVLEQTTLAEIAAAFGGTVLSTGEAGEHMLWLCYDLAGPEGPVRTWFVADGEMGGPERSLTAIAVEVAGGPAARHGCQAAPADFALPDLGFPGIGSGAAALEAHFGALAVDAEGRASFESWTPVPGRPGFQAYRDLSYRLEAGRVTGFALSQMTGD